MQDIEPYYAWRNIYSAEDDEKSPFFGREYDEFQYENKIYNYYIHPQWDSFGSATLYAKILDVDYSQQSCIIELIGEWNDCLYNDIMFLKHQVIDPLIKEEIYKFVIICENVLNFHGSDDCYYEEWQEEVAEEGGWIIMLNTQKHVEDEMVSTQLQHQILVGEPFDTFNWRRYKPSLLIEALEMLVHGSRRRLRY